MADKASFQDELLRRFSQAYKRTMLGLLEAEQDAMTLERVHKLENHVHRMTATLETSTLKTLVRGISDRLNEEPSLVEAPMELPRLPADPTHHTAEELTAKIEAEVKKISTLRCLLAEFEDSKLEYLGRDLTVVDHEELI